MRTILSFLLTLLGIAGVYLFACGAAGEPFWLAGGWERALERMLWPIHGAGFGSSVILTAGLVCLAAGIFTSPRGAVWIVRGPNGEKQELVRSDPGVPDGSVNKVLKIVLVFNVLVVGAISLFLCAGVQHSSRPEIFGALYVVAAVEAVIGLCLAAFLWVTRKPSPRKFQIVYPVSAGLVVVEALWLAGILVAGYF